MTREKTQVAIVGGGLAGSLLAIILARRGLAPIVVERGDAFDSANQSTGRSINLALAARGIAALRHADIYAAVEPLLIPMTGRMLHESGGTQRFLAYGQHSDELIYSVSRAALNRKIYELARDRFGVEYRFRHQCVGLGDTPGSTEILSPEGTYVLETSFLVAADGAGSKVRQALESAGAVRAHEDILDHGYKELAVPPDRAGNAALAENALHIWPRGGFMLIALRVLGCIHRSRES
jgi:kynurenine 3-monooxygenase